WVSLDIHQHFGTEWLTGGPVGYWYSVNDYAMTRLVKDYVSASGDLGFLQEEYVTSDGHSGTIASHVDSWAYAWKQFQTKSGLADYGEVDNLLECVSTYTHEVASLNAANAWCLRVAAEIADIQAKPDQASQKREDADHIVKLVHELY